MQDCKIRVNFVSIALLLGVSPLASASLHPTSMCPTNFYDVPLYPDARLCQVFADELPASMTYHADASMGEAQAFYQQHFGEKVTVEEQKGRIVISSGSNNLTIIVSQDGGGSQVDVLVKQAG